MCATGYCNLSIVTQLVPELKFKATMFKYKSQVFLQRYMKKSTDSIDSLYLGEITGHSAKPTVELGVEG